MNAEESTPLRNHIIAADQRLSQSLIWQIQRQYFLHSGMSAWQEDVVPSAISSNPFMARAYSQVACGYLRDCVQAAASGQFALHSDQPIYIVELGAGSGRLAYHFLHQFFGVLDQSPFTDLNITYIMTDFAPDIVDFWRRHARFQPWAAAGRLDFALFDATDVRPLTLLNANVTLTPDRAANPLILIANYFFDSIPQDSFVLADGQLHENLLTLYSSRPEPNLADATIWERLSLAYEAIPLEKPYYADSSYNQILDAYETYFPDTTLTFPNVGLDCLRFWQDYGNGRLLLLSSDRGYTLAESLLEQDDPLPNLHGSFSLMVNYHAIGQYVELADGLALHAGHYQDNLQVTSYLLGQLPLEGVETRLAFNAAVVEGGPDDFFALKTALEAHINDLTLPQILSYLRLSAWDADIFKDCFPALLAHIQQSPPVWYPDVAAVVSKVWNQYLPLSAADELFGMIQRLLAEMGYEQESLELFQVVHTTKLE